MNRFEDGADDGKLIGVGLNGFDAARSF